MISQLIDDEVATEDTDPIEVAHRRLINNLREMAKHMEESAKGMEEAAPWRTPDEQDLMRDWIAEKRAVAEQLLAVTTEKFDLVF